MGGRVLSKQDRVVGRTIWTLTIAGMISSNSQATCSSVRIATSKGFGFRIVADNRTAYHVVKQQAVPMPRKEELWMLLVRVAAFCKLGLSRRCSPCFQATMTKVLTVSG